METSVKFFSFYILFMVAQVITEIISLIWSARLLGITQLDIIFRNLRISFVARTFQGVSFSLRIIVGSVLIIFAYYIFRESVDMARRLCRIFGGLE